MAEESLSVEPESVYLSGTNWTYIDVLFAFAAGLVAALVAGIIALGFSGGEPISTAVLVGFVVPSQAVGTFAALWLLMKRRRYGDWLASYGLVLRGRDWWAVLVGIGLQIGAGLILTGISTVVSFEPPEQSVATSIADLDQVWPKVVAAIAVVVLAPLTEEIVFRGMLLSRMLRSLSRHGAVILSGFIFAAIHVLLDPASWYAAIGLFPIGIVLGYLALSTGDLSRAIWAHAGINGLGAIFLLFGDELITEDAALGWFSGLFG